MELTPSPNAARTFRGALIQFVLSGMIALIIIGAIAFIALRRESTAESIRTAQQLTEYIATSIVEPSIAERPELLEGDPAALAAFDARVRERILNEESGIVRVKIWNKSGTVVYSDAAGLTGNTYELSHDIQEALETRRPVAEVSTLEQPENELDDLTGKLLEVYVPLTGPNQEPFVFETYRSYSTIDAAGSTVLGKFLPIFLLALLVLALVFAPLGWSMARQLRQGQRERERLLMSAIDASDRERRRIASEVHDGPVQELAGLSFALAGAADRATSASPTEIRRSLENSAQTARGVMRRLRGLLVEIHPPALHASGLEAALSDTLARLPAKGIEATFDPGQLPELDPTTEALLFRGAQEVLRNVAEHSKATSVRVSVSSQNGAIRLDIADNGRGFDSVEHEQRRAEGHLGLDLLGDLLRDAGGNLDIDSAPGSGTRVGIVVPRP